MKKIILLFLIFNATFSFSQTSVYHEFPDSNAVWNFDCVQWMCMPIGAGGQANVHFQYSVIINGDTTINGLTYDKLFTPFIHEILNVNCQMWMGPGYKGAVREDVSLKKVFYVPQSDTAEQLLYDFNMQVGDTVQGYLRSYLQPGFDTVISIDSVLVGNTFRKRWYVNNSYFISIIEGIGSTYGLIEPSPGTSTDFPTYDLTCYRLFDATLYPDTLTNCDLITSLPSVEEGRNTIHVYPNPSRGRLNIESDDAGMEEIRLLDLSGRTIQIWSAAGEQSFTIRDLPDGMFILEIARRDDQTTRLPVTINH